MKITRPPLDLNQRITLLDSIFAKESVRGRVLVAAEILNATLAETLMKHFIGSEDLSKLDADSLLGRNHPLSTFASRITACYRLGLISETDRKALDYLRDLRNVAAHECSHMDFGSKRFEEHLGKFVEMVCQDEIAALQMVAVGPCPQSCTDWFTMCSAFLMFKLTSFRDAVQPAALQFSQIQLLSGQDQGEAQKG